MGNGALMVTGKGKKKSPRQDDGDQLKRVVAP